MTLDESILHKLNECERLLKEVMQSQYIVDHHLDFDVERTLWWVRDMQGAIASREAPCCLISAFFPPKRVTRLPPRFDANHDLHMIVDRLKTCDMFMEEILATDYIRKGNFGHPLEIAQDHVRSLLKDHKMQIP